MEGIQEEDFDTSPFKDSVSLSVSKLAKLLKVQAKAIQGIV
jgi:plasmid maintenance system antidote protein VapI